MANNRFWVRAVRKQPPEWTPKSKRKPGKFLAWSLYDAGTGEFLGESTKDVNVLVQQLRSLRASHHEPIDAEPIWHEDRPRGK